MGTKFWSFLIFASFTLLSSMAIAQNKAQIQIRRNINGVESEESREIILKEGENIEEILTEMGVLDELGQLKSGQDIEIRIEKSGDVNNQETINLFLAPDNANLEFPEFATAPPLENKTYLGVMLRQDVNYNHEEVIISEVIEDSPAEACGLEAGDIIVRLDKTEIRDVQTVIEYVQSKKPGDKVNVTVRRDNKERKFKTELGEKALTRPWSFSIPEIPSIPQIPRIPEVPANPHYNFRFGPDSITIYCPPSPGCVLPDDSVKIGQPFSWNGEGLSVQETAFLGVTPAVNQTDTGVRINVEEGTAAEKMELLDGDVIVSVNGISVNNFDELADQVSKMKPGGVIELVILRNGKQKEVSGEIGKRSVSGFNDFRIFHDFKGMDEGGNFLYDYEFDMDEEDVELRMEELLRELDKEQGRLDNERERIESELDRLNRGADSMTIKIQILEISDEDTNTLNGSGSRIETTNTLTPDQISFFPNPGDGVLNLTFSLTSKAPVRVTLNNASGELVYLEERAMFDGQYRNTIDISDEPNGTYFLQIIQDGKYYSKKIIKGF